jgi:hypothetical protein
LEIKTNLAPACSTTTSPANLLLYCIQISTSACLGTSARSFFHHPLWQIETTENKVNLSFDSVNLFFDCPEFRFLLVPQILVCHHYFDGLQSALTPYVVKVSV